jgi:hypothetical protein
VSKNKSRKNLQFSVFVPNSSIEVQPLAAVATKDAHGPSNTSPAGQQPPLRSDVKVFIGDPPSFLFSIPEREAQDRIRRHEARDINTGKRRRGIQVISKAQTHNSQPHTLQGQLSEWQESIQREHPDLWAEQGDMATLDQVEGLPVVGRAVKLFCSRPKRAA